MLQSPYRALGRSSHPNIPFPIPFGHHHPHDNLLSPVARKLGLGLGSAKKVDSPDEMASDSEASTASPREIRTCFCGNTIIDGEGIYCSTSCARSDAFSTLCNKPNPPSSLLASASVQSSDLSRNPSNASTSTTSSASSDWEATHYGRMCRADLRREERKEERRRRRAEGGSTASSTGTASSSNRGTMLSVASSSRVPDLVGGGSHSRNASIASSRTSFSSAGGLSRQCSNASSSSSSRRGYGGGVHVDTVIMEDDDEEEEWLVSDPNYEAKYPLPTAPKYRVQQYPHPHQRRRPSISKTHGHGQGNRKKLEPFGMGKDMRDVLEEIIQMEKEFVIDETSDDQMDRQESTPGVFTAVFDRPPRTPSPACEGKRESVVPGAPLRGGAGGGHHRKSVSMANAVGSPPPVHRAHSRPRPPSTYGHSASLSESHTALYLATASPETGRRSASPPRLKARNSMTFTPEAAGPVIPQFLAHSPNLATPSRRRPIPSPSAHHPTMSGWRFPHSNTATPTKLTIDTQNLEVPTPTRPRMPPRLDEADMHPHPHPHLLWPPNLAPSLFPMSPGMNGTPIDIDDPAARFRQQVNTSPMAHYNHSISPPNSGVRLGYLLGSGDEAVDVDMDMDDDHSTAHGHGFSPVYHRDQRHY